MLYRIQADDKAREEFAYACDTYQDCEKIFRAWRDAIVKTVSGETDGEDARLIVPLGAILDDVENDPTDLGELELKQTKWGEAWKKFKKLSTLDQTKGLLFVLKRRKPPWELYTAYRKFRCLSGRIELEMHTAFEVNHIDKVVGFWKFEIFSAK